MSMRVTPEPAATIEFYFDFISPFGYFASLRVQQLAARRGRTVDWYAIRLGVSVVKIMGLKPLLETPLKGAYLVREAERYARLHGLAVRRPFDSPQMDPRPCARAFYWLKRYRPGSEVRLAAALLNAYWVEGIDLGTPQAAARAAVGAGFDGDEVLAAIASDESQTLLRANVEAATARGIFGSPTVVIDGEPFWGVQSLELAERWLDTGGW
jgi:2-hydroxychromene-2-carboxylate isomerase